jgi:hypothetical protein
MTDVMIDIETLGTDPETPVISIGAVEFDLRTGVIDKEKSFYQVLDISQQLMDGRKPTASTLQWWMGQDDAAKKVFKEDAHPVNQVLHDFLFWFKGKHAHNVWGKGPTFDVSIMQNLLQQYGYKVPWKFWNIRDVRTVLDILGDPKLARHGVFHNAVDDAVHQSKEMISCYKRIK